MLSSPGSGQLTGLASQCSFKEMEADGSFQLQNNEDQTKQNSVCDHNVKGNAQ